MVKKAELFKAVKQKDLGKVQQLLSPLAKNKDKKKFDYAVVPNNTNKLLVTHINVNCQEPATMYTPLHLAILHGSTEIVRELLYYNADVNSKDKKSNTPLHLAVFHNSLEVVELLLANNVEINAINDDGNTALHIVCQGQTNEELGGLIVKKLIVAGADVWIKNKFRLEPLDLAASCNKLDIVKLFLHHFPQLRKNSCAIVEAAIRDYTDVVEILLDYGISCNGLDEIHGSGALHEAVRFNRIEVVKLLLSFQANPDLQNVKKETPRILACELPITVREKMLQLFEDQEILTPRFPKMITSTVSTVLEEQFKIDYQINKDYPALPTDITWTKNEPLFCSTCTEKNPNFHILDGNLSTFWVIPVLHDAWTILDLHSEHIITGITIFGWKSPQMIKTFHLQCSLSVQGPWQTIITQSCKCLGSSDPKDPAVPQKFTGFSVCCQYLRLYIVDNHSGNYMCFQGIQLHGADSQIFTAVNECGLQTLADSFINKGFNTWKIFLNIPQEAVDELVSDVHSKSKLWDLIGKEKRKMYPMKVLSWFVPPPVNAVCGEKLPDFSVQSDPSVTEMVTLSVSGAEISGNTCIKMQPGSGGNPSVATFSNISIQSVGTFYVTIQGESSAVLLSSSKPIEVCRALISEKDISSAFQEIQQILNEVQATLPS